MKRALLTGVTVVALAGLAAVDSAQAIEYTLHCLGREGCPWYRGYYNPAWGTPVALVVPPTAEAQMSWGWGVGNTRVSPICPQFHRNWPGPVGYGPRVFRPTPPWPSDTDQFGFYYIRGPW